jgi:molybdenum cofactor cytidylyltransferase
MKLSEALRVQPGESIAFSGSGGKTNALIKLAQEIDYPVIATTTTHFHKDQLGFADRIISICNSTISLEMKDFDKPGITLLTGDEVEDERISGVNLDQLDTLFQFTKRNGINLLIEADGSRQRPLKAPGEHEPVIPAFIDKAVVVAGLSAIGKSYSSEYVHRIEEYSRLSGLRIGDTITSEAICQVLLHQNGGLKGIPNNAQKICILNQADDDHLQAIGKRLAMWLRKSFDSVVITSLDPPLDTKINYPAIDESLVDYLVYGVYEPVVGILLAAGGSSRMGTAKQLLPWKDSSLIKHIVSKIVDSGLDRTFVVIGAYEDLIRDEIASLPVEIVFNPDWESGQSSSVKAGLSAIPENTGAVIFFLADQPNISQLLIRSLIEKHSAGLNSIIAPIIAGQRGNPVLFDRSTFGDFWMLEGDAGGRQLFSKFKVAWLDWYDESILIDIDTNEDYRIQSTNSA